MKTRRRETIKLAIMIKFDLRFQDNIPFCELAKLFHNDTFSTPGCSLVALRFQTVAADCVFERVGKNFQGASQQRRGLLVE